MSFFSFETSVERRYSHFFVCTRTRVGVFPWVGCVRLNNICKRGRKDHLVRWQWSIIILVGVYNIFNIYTIQFFIANRSNEIYVYRHIVHLIILLLFGCDKNIEAD